MCQQLLTWCLAFRWLVATAPHSRQEPDAGRPYGIVRPGQALNCCRPCSPPAHSLKPAQSCTLSTCALYIARISTNCTSPSALVCWLLVQGADVASQGLFARSDAAGPAPYVRTAPSFYYGRKYHTNARAIESGALQVRVLCQTFCRADAHKCMHICAISRLCTCTNAGLSVQLDRGSL